MTDLDHWTSLSDRPSDRGQGTTAQDPVLRVLVIDDDPDIHRLLGARLEARGFKVTSATSGEEGIRKLREANADLVFLDVAMAGMTGIEVLDVLRSERLDLAVILTTAFSSEQVAIAALRHGADDYLCKPFDRAEFQATLDRTIARLNMSRQIAQLRRELDAKQAQLAAELERAAVLQSELLPVDNPPLPGFEIGARCLPARIVGGDFYDWQQLPRGNFALTVGDVMGKGMSAALLMATVRAVVRAMATEHGPADTVQRTASALDDDFARSGTFVTLFHAQLDVETSELKHVDAGHGQVFVRRATGAVVPLTPGGLPVGVLSGEQYVEGKITLAPGDRLVVYSDGLTEARPDLFRAHGTLAAQITDDETAAATAQRLVSLATASGQLPDDLTVVVLHCLPEPTVRRSTAGRK